MTYKIETYQPITSYDEAKTITDQRLIFGTGICYRDGKKIENFYEKYERKRTPDELRDVERENKLEFEKWINEYKRKGFHIDRIDKLRGLFTPDGGLVLYPITVFFKKNERNKRNSRSNRNKKRMQG